MAASAKRKTPARAGSGSSRHSTSQAKAKASTPPRREPPRRDCTNCGGSGEEPILSATVLEGVTQAELAKGSGISESQICRMFSDDPNQRRQNPKLDTVRKLQRWLAKKAKRHVTLELTASMLEG